MTASQNLMRRSLTPEQRAALVVRYHDWQKQEARARMKQQEAGALGKEYGKEGGRGNKKPPTHKREQGVSDKNSRSTAGQLAKEAGVSRRKAHQAIAVAKADPELLTEVIAGKAKLADAANIGKADPESDVKEIGA